jgi:fructose-1,6-bisphosphatase/inositol monophosphatase family enzyme
VTPDPDLAALADALAGVGRLVRDAVLATAPSPSDRDVVRREGGDDIFGLDVRADEVLRRGFEHIGERWPGRLVMEGFDEPLAVGNRDGPWVFVADPIDGTRPWLAGKRSAWVLVGGGRSALTLEDLEVGAAVELPTRRARYGLVASAVRGAGVRAHDDDLAGERSPREVELRPRAGADLRRAYVTIARVSPGTKEVLGRFEDALLGGLETYDDQYLSSGGQLMGLATGADAAVLDPRPLAGAHLVAHPYDLAAVVVAREAGVVVEALPPGPLRVPLAPTTPVAWAGYANVGVAGALRAAWARASTHLTRPVPPG